MLSLIGTAQVMDLLHDHGGHRAGSGINESVGGVTNSGETAAIRAWAKANGYEVSDRGRIHQSIKDAYQAAQNANA